MTRQVRKAIFPVGGLGTRFLPATKAMPKEMLPIVDTPLIQYAVEEARASGVEEFIFVTGRDKTAIEDYFDRSYELESLLSARGKAKELEAIQRWLPQPGQITYTRQQRPLGLGHAVWCARNLIGDEPFAVILADDLIMSRTPCLEQMIDAHEATGGSMVAVAEVPRQQVTQYGIIDVGAMRDRLVEVRGLVEKPAPHMSPSTLAIIGRYILEPQVLDRLERLGPGAGGEIQLTDAIAGMIKERPLHGFRFEGRRFDCGDKIGFFEANIAFALARPELAAAASRVLRRYSDADERPDLRVYRSARQEAPSANLMIGA